MISYPGTDMTGKQGVQRSFSQRARGRPYAEEAFLDEDLTETTQDQLGQRKPSARHTAQDSRATALPSHNNENPSRRRQLIQDNIRSAAGSVRSPRDYTDPGGNTQGAAYNATTIDTGLTQAPTLQEPNLSTDQRDWAPDRSPLQKLEVTLNDIRKEEKRARVQEAEMLHREKTRSQRPNERSSASTKRTQPTTISHPSTIEDAGMVRSLSNTHRDRLHHSTTIESHKPDASRLATDRPIGQTFDYQTLSLPTRSVTITRRGKPIGSPEEISTRRSVSNSQTHPYAEPGPSSNQTRSVSAEQPRLQAAGTNHPSAFSADQTTQMPFNETDRIPTEQERSASRRAALEQLTGSAPPSRTKSGSRRPHAEFNDASQAAARTSVSNRGPPTAFDNDRPGSRGLHAPSAAVGPIVSIGPDRQQPPTAPYNEPVGANSQPLPGSKRRSSVSFKEPYDRRRPVDEWKAADTARLLADDFLLEASNDQGQNKAWWEQDAKFRRKVGKSRATGAFESAVIDDRLAEFQPRLYLKCGPLLRYTGMKRTTGEGAKEYWRGTVMMVTQDTQSSYETPPTLRLFAQPRSLVTRPKPVAEDEQPSVGYHDPIAGTVKMSRIGRALYVRPVESLPENQDLSLLETDDGLFQSSPPMANNDGESVSVTPFASRNSDANGERFGRYKEIKGVRLYADPDRDVTFWLFKLEIQLGPEQQHIGYRINGGAASGFWVPAEGQTMNIMFHSCNGFSLSVKPDQFSGPDPLWRDVLNAHQSRPFHVMIGGGDQIYNDKAMNQTHYFKEWTTNKNLHYKHHAPFTTEMKEELETFYLDNYCTWFSQGMFGVAASQIPMTNMWDDHDIIDGFGSYPHSFQLSPVFSGIGNIAFKYYMLFQHHSVDAMTQADEPSWLLGYKPGPYIKQLSRSVFLSLGRSVAFLALDCRTERMKNQVLSLDTCDMALERCRKEIVEGETKHLILLLGVPIAYPRMNWLENVLTSRAMDPVKAMGRYGVLKSGFLNRFDGGVEVLDDLDDHWTAHHHKEERNEFIRELQDLAAERSVRITILGGDVHLCAIGQFYSNPKLKIPKDRDHRYMPNVISSAIVNTPPPEMLADALNKRNKVHHLDQYTDESMIPMFTHDTNLKKRNNKHLLPRRNWCAITEYVPGRTPPSSRSSSPSGSEFSEYEEVETTNPQPKRRLSLSREDINPRTLFRRISTRNAPPTSYHQGGDVESDQRPASFDVDRSHQSQQRGLKGKSLQRSASETRESTTDSQHAVDTSRDARQPPPLRPGFHRRPTNLSEKAAKKGNVPAVDADGNEFDVNDHVNLDGGLDIILNCEVDQHDPLGVTEPYRLLVPALWYDGSSDREKLDSAEAGGIQRKPTLLNKIGLAGRHGHKAAQNQGAGNWGQQMSDEESYSSGSEEVIRKSTERPPKKKLGFFGSLRKKRPDEDYGDGGSVHEQDQSRAGDHYSSAPLTNKTAALNSTSVHDRVTHPNEGVSSHASSRVAVHPSSVHRDIPGELHQASKASFNRPPSSGRDAPDPAPGHTSSIRMPNVLRKVNRKHDAPLQPPTMAPIDTSQQNSGIYDEPPIPNRRNSYTIGLNRSGNAQNQGQAVPGADHYYDADSAYISSQGQGQNRRIVSNPTPSAAAANPPTSYPGEGYMPGNNTSASSLPNPKQGSLRGHGILGRFSSRRSASADQVPTSAQVNAADANEDFQPAPPPRTLSQGYSGIEAYREKPKRGLSFKDRTRNFLSRLDGRRDDDDRSDGYSYSSEESWSSENIGEANDRDPSQPKDHRQGLGITTHDGREGSMVDEIDGGGSAHRPGATRGLSQKIRLNMMRFGSVGRGGGRSDGASARHASGKENSKDSGDYY